MTRSHASPPAPPGPRFERMQVAVLLATMFCYLFYYTGRHTFGFAIPGMEADLGLSKTTLGWVSTAMLWSYALGQSINGNLGDRFGGRRMMTLGALLSCALSWATSFGQNLWHVALAWSCNGYAQSMGWAPGSRVLSNWWGHEHRGRVYGLYVFAAGMSSVLAYAASSLIVQLQLPWVWLFRLPVLLLLVGGLVYYLVVRDRPEDLGLALDETPRPDSPSAPRGGNDDDSTTSMLQRYRQVLAHPAFLIASLAIAFQSAARYGLLYWVPVHLLGENWKDTGSSIWISLALPLGMALGALVGGWVSDRVFHGNRSRLIVLFLALAAVVSLVMLGLPRQSMWGLPLLFLCGFLTYGPQSAFWALCPDLLGRRLAGTGTGVMNTFAYALAGLCEPLIGWLIEYHDQTGLVFLVVAVNCLVGAGLALLIRR